MNWNQFLHLNFSRAVSFNFSMNKLIKRGYVIYMEWNGSDAKTDLGEGIIIAKRVMPLANYK